MDLRLPRELFVPGDHVPMEVEFVNGSGQKVTIWECGFCLDHRVEVEDEHGHSPPLTDQGEKCRRLYSPNGPRDRNYPVRLAPGARYRRPAVPWLDRLFRLAPGAYRVRVTYEDGEGQTHLKCVSKWVHFQILPRAANPTRK